MNYNVGGGMYVTVPDGKLTRNALVLYMYNTLLERFKPKYILQNIIPLQKLLMQPIGEYIYLHYKEHYKYLNVMLPPLYQDNSPSILFLEYPDIITIHSNATSYRMKYDTFIQTKLFNKENTYVKPKTTMFILNRLPHAPMIDLYATAMEDV